MIKTKRLRRLNIGIITGLFVFISTVIPLANPIAANAATQTKQQLFESAAAKYEVPTELLLAISYNQSRWESHPGQVSASGGYGLMHLTADIPAKTSGKGDKVEQKRQGTEKRLLDEAASASGKSVDSLKKDDSANVEAAAALLAKYGKEINDNKVPESLDKWFDATKRFSSYNDEEAATRFANSVYSTLEKGTSATTKDGQTLKINARSDVSNAKRPVPETKSKSKDRNFRPECPRSLDCDYIPAAYELNSANPTGDINDYGNYEQTNRPKNMNIKYIVVHNTEGSYDSTVSHFQDSSALVSSHYVVRSEDGHVTQMVKNEDVAWHAGNMYLNNHSIGIEHEGYAIDGATWYTEEMYQSSARLVKYLADKYNIPVDRQHILGHDQVPSTTNERIPTMHWDPGPYWDWDRYMELIGGKRTIKTAPQVGKTVTISPHFKTNQPTVVGCDEDDPTICHTEPAQPTNLVYLRSAPSATAPLVKDSLVHPDGSDSTYKASDVSASATTGQRFVVADQKGEWTAVWFNGQKAWFQNPGNKNTALTIGLTPKKVVPKGNSAPIYGRAYPESSAYPAGITPDPVVPLGYNIPKGQAYPVADDNLQTDYYFNSSIDHRNPLDRTVVRGKDRYIEISYNHRVYYVKASDVKVVY